MTDMNKVILHRTGDVTMWSVYEQRWVRTARPSDAELAAMSTSQRLRVCRHLGIAI